MIKVIVEEGMHLTCFFCDMCKNKIDDAEKANSLQYSEEVEFFPPYPGGDLTPYPNFRNGAIYDVMHVHQGQCDRAAQEWMKTTNKAQAGWTPLSVDLVYLLNNTGYTENKWIEWKRTAENLSSI